MAPQGRDTQDLNISKATSYQPLYDDCKTRTNTKDFATKQGPDTKTIKQI